MTLSPSAPVSGHTHRAVLATLAVVSLVLAWTWMWLISAHDPWYRNTDMNIHNLADALSLNSGYAPGVVDQPAAPTKFLLALDYRIRNALGLLPTWTLKRFARSAEPLRELAHLVQVGREHSRLLVIGFILCAAGFVWDITRRFDLGCFTIVLLCGSSGLLFHGLLVRPELICLGFGGVLALHCAWRGTVSSQPALRSLWMFLAGVCAGLALLSKLPGLFYLALVFAWCALAPLLPSADDKVSPAEPSRGWTSALCLVTGLCTLVLLLVMAPDQTRLNPVTTLRLRGMATFVALLPLVTLAGARNRIMRYLLGRGTDLVLLLAGLLASFVGWFGLLQTVLPYDAAMVCMGKILNTVVYPDPLLTLLTHPGTAHRTQEALKFFLETPVLIVGTTALAITVASFRTVPLRWRAFILLLLVQGLGMMLLMSKRLFLHQYSAFVQVPFLLIWALSFAALQDRWLSRNPTAPRWPVALATMATLFLVLTVPIALNPKYNGFQDDSALPVRDLTLTFLYDHDAHPPAYLAAMKKRYPTRAEFAAELNRFLSDPSHRH